MLRDKIKSAMKDAMKASEAKALSTCRLVLAAIKDKDIAARSKGVSDGIADDEILQLLQSMIKQRRDSIELYTKGGRPELAAGEEEEIKCIEVFLPEQMSDDEVDNVSTDVIEEVKAEGMRDMGKVMAVLKDRYAGQMDFAKASSQVKKILSAQ